MKEGRIDKAQGDTGNGANEGDKAIQGGGAQEGDNGNEEANTETKGIFGPLDPRIPFPGSWCKEGILQDTDGGEHLKGDGEEDGKGVEELNELDSPGSGGEIEKDDGLNLVTKGKVGEATDGAENKGDKDHSTGEDHGEALGLLHGVTDGDDEADALEGKDGCTDEEGKVGGVKMSNDSRTTSHEGGNVIVVEVTDATDDENIGDEGEEGEVLDLTYQGKGDVDAKLSKNKKILWDDPAAIGDEHKKVPKILCHKDGVCTAEANLIREGKGRRVSERKRREEKKTKEAKKGVYLRNSNGREDGLAHARTV